MDNKVIIAIVIILILTVVGIGVVLMTFGDEIIEGPVYEEEDEDYESEPEDEGEPYDDESEVTFSDCGEVDYEGYSYKTVEIGEDCWLAEDLRYDSGCKDVDWDGNACMSQIDGYEGFLYQWSAAMDGSDEEGSQGICPDGWYIPTKEDWVKLDDYLIEAGYGENRGDVLKDIEEGWCMQSDGCGEVGFLSLPTGYSPYGDTPTRVHNEAHYWSSTSVGDDEAVAFGIFDSGEFEEADRDKVKGFSVRCIRE